MTRSGVHSPREARTFASEENELHSLVCYARIPCGEEWSALPREATAFSSEAVDIAPPYAMDTIQEKKRRPLSS